MSKQARDISLTLQFAIHIAIQGSVVVMELHVVDLCDILCHLTFRIEVLYLRTEYYVAAAPIDTRPRSRSWFIHSSAERKRPGDSLSQTPE